MCHSSMTVKVSTESPLRLRLEVCIRGRNHELELKVDRFSCFGRLCHWPTETSLQYREVFGLRAGARPQFRALPLRFARHLNSPASPAPSPRTASFFLVKKQNAAPLTPRRASQAAEDRPRKGAPTAGTPTAGAAPSAVGTCPPPPSPFSPSPC
jgi:hypothetical protein